ncbi:hypothetical protein [Kitasatospora viridis]|uniref:Small secreted domain DUF320 n=1 Tax=Kitasatospora viridis TaxID=281105 RepID=A0A561ULB9_9ACTN|nr:hypothetical protein [Kitasatospora viridis]TWG00149.1 hypothetical protein FHX73_114018 [Kitasatospora viridis]
MRKSAVRVVVGVVAALVIAVAAGPLTAGPAAHTAARATSQVTPEACGGTPMGCL